MSSERQAADRESPWWGEHVYRYEEAVRRVRPGDRVLDLACGSGFGTDMLAAASGGLVLGADLSRDATRQSRARWHRPNLAFAVMDGSALPLPDASLDAVVSFETIEHTERYADLLEEFARVLKQGGVALISTPNAAVTSPEGVIANRFHTQEFRREELEALLWERFVDVRVFGQRFTRYDPPRGARRLAAMSADRLLYLRGVRKLPLRFKDRLMRWLGGTPLYPTPADFLLVEEDDRVAGSATLFAVCRKGRAKPPPRPGLPDPAAPTRASDLRSR